MVVQLLLQVKSRGPIKLTDEADSGPAVLESQPVQNVEGVVKASAIADKDLTSIEGGRARQLRDRFLKQEDERPKERKQIKLFEETEANQPAVIESQPSQGQEGVVRAADTVSDDITVEKGHIKGKADFFVKAADPNRMDKGPKKPINIRGESDQDIILESQPKPQMEGVVRACDEDSSIDVEKGKAKNLLGFWANKNEEEDDRKERKQVKIETDDGPAIVESTPIENPDVVKSGQASDDVLFFKRGQAKNTAARFLQQQDEPKEPKKPIKLDFDQGPAVIESQPTAGDEDIVRSTYEPAVKTVEKGNIKGMLSRFKDAEAEAASVKTSSASWKRELEEMKKQQEVSNDVQEEEERREVSKE